jgi:RNA polymerase sigma-70 factor (ECF subfamily)
MEEIAVSATMLPSSSVRPDRIVFETIVHAYRDRIFRFALASLRDVDAAQTIVQDCFFKAHRAWGGFRNDCSLDSWLMKIAVNLIRDHTRNRRLQFWRRAEAKAPDLEWAANLGDVSAHSPEQRAIVKQRLNAVWKAAEALTERQRTVFLLRFVEDMDLLDIAAATGMKEGTVKTHLFRAVHMIRERMESPI